MGKIRIRDPRSGSRSTPFATLDSCRFDIYESNDEMSRIDKIIMLKRPDSTQNPIPQFYYITVPLDLDPQHWFQGAEYIRHRRCCGHDTRQQPDVAAYKERCPVE
jgi:hypothetical protein